MVFFKKNGDVEEYPMHKVEDILDAFNSHEVKMAAVEGISPYTSWNEADEDQIFNHLVKHFSEDDKQSLAMVHQGNMSKEEFLKLVDEFLIGIQVTDSDMHDKIVKRYDKYTWGYYVLDDLINNHPEVSDINVVGWNNIRIKSYGKRSKASGVTFKSKEDLITFLNHVAVKNKISISDSNATPTFTDKVTAPDYILRFSILTKYVSSSGTPYISIRKTPTTKYTMKQLVGYKMFDPEVSEYLSDAAKYATGLLFTGKGASGKTTIMNTLIEESLDETRTMVIQEAEELFSMRERDMLFTHVVTNKGEGKISYDLRGLVRSGLLNDLDRIIIGEIKGDEAADFLMAAYTGHSCWASVHGISATEAMDKLADYALHASNYSKKELMKMLHYMSTVIFMKSFCAAEVAEVVGYDEESGKLQYRVTVRNGHFVPGLRYDKEKRCVVEEAMRS